MAMASIFLPFPPTSHHSLLLSTFLSPHPTTPRPLKRTTHCSLPRRPTTPHYIPNHIPDPSYVRILDTTLRDGEQSPGAAMTPNKKLDLARHLARLRVDVIEAGFPGASRGDFEAVKAIAEEVGNATVDDDGNVPVICAFSRCVKKDIDAAWDAVRHAKYPRINVFIATSDIHMQYKLQKSRDEVIGIAKEMISYAKSLGFQDIEFAAEDSGRADREFLCRILAEVIEAGASTVCIADTVGINIPCEFGDLIAHIKANTPGIENAIISVHCHDDLGLATSNTLAGAFAGARQLEVTVNGIGERAGNASLEEVVMAIKCRGKDRMGGLYTRINPKMIVMASKMVEEYTGMHVQPNKAIVGANAFAHESGIHQDGMLKHKATYEIISPEDVGLTQSCESRIRLGKLSGRHALRSKLLELGFELDDKELNDVFWRFKAKAEKTKHISDADLEALVSDGIFKPQAIWSLSDLEVTCGTLGSNATVKLIGVDGIEHVGSVVGTGPVHVAFKAIDSIVKKPVEIVDYSVTSVTEGINGMSSIRVVIRKENSHASSHATTGMAVYRNFSGTGAGTDIIVSSAQAYLDALNKMLSSTTYVNSQASSYTSAG